MTRRQKDPLRLLTSEEPDWLTRLSRSHSEPAAHVARAKALLAVADGSSYTAAAKAAGPRWGDAVTQLVSRFNQEGRGPRCRGTGPRGCSAPDLQATKSVNASSPRRVGCPIAKGMGQPHGR